MHVLVAEFFRIRKNSSASLSMKLISIQLVFDGGDENQRF